MVVQTNDRDTERKVLSILEVLSESPEPLGSIAIARVLKEQGLSLSERTVRYHLKITDERGYTQPMGRDGRMLTKEGRAEVRSALVPEQVGFIISKIELLAFNTTLNPDTGKGQDNTCGQNCHKPRGVPFFNRQKFYSLNVFQKLAI